MAGTEDGTTVLHGLMQALLAVQAEAETMKRDAENPHFKSKYLSLPALMEQGLPLLAKYGLAWAAFPSGTAEEPRLRYVLAHAASGEREEDSMPLCPSKRDSQGLGSAITYGRRYSFESVLGFVAVDDDDGNAASEAPARTRRAPRRTATPATSPDADAATLKEVRALVRSLGAGEQDTVRLALTTAGVEYEGKVSDAIKDLTQDQAVKVRDLLARADAHMED